MKIFVLIFFISCSTTVPADNWQGQVDRYLDHVTKYDRASGEVTLYEGDNKVYSRRYGKFSQKNKTRFKIASISKIFTAVLIIKLIESGELTYETQLEVFYPKVRKFKGITIEQLLRHRSGLVNYYLFPRFSKNLSQTYSENQFLNDIKKHNLRFVPGSKFEYSNSGYLILSYIIEKITKLNFNDALKKYITKPLGLKDTYVYSSSQPNALELKSYTRLTTSEWKSLETKHESIGLGAGSLVSSADDLKLFFRAVLKSEFLKPESLDKMLTMIDDYGLGIFPSYYRDYKGLGHNGLHYGRFASNVVYFEELDLLFVNFSNAYDMYLNDISLAVLDAYAGYKIDLPQFPVIKEIPIKTYRKYLGEYESEDLPLDIKIFIEKGLLKVQATGQGSFRVDTYSENKIGSYVNNNLIINFIDPENMTLYQAGKAYTFFRK